MRECDRNEATCPGSLVYVERGSHSRVIDADGMHMNRQFLFTASLVAALAGCPAGATSPTALAPVPAEGSARSDTDELPASVESAVEPACQLTGAPETIRRDGAAVLQVWQLPGDEVLQRAVLPDDAGYLAYRAAIRADGADLRKPVSDEPEPRNRAEAQVWANERYNGELAHSGKVGAIEPITCLDALFFAYQHARVSQITQPTEFLLSVLRKDVDGRPRLVAIFGASDVMFPPKTVYGFDIVDEYLAKGWRFWYVLHNHTIQKHGERLALGNPVLSTSDVQLMRNLAAGSGLQSARVTNGFYTFSARADEFASLRSRD